jgi:hypothetical protein
VIQHLWRSGDPSEPLLSYVEKINGTNRMMRPNTTTDFEFFKDSKSMRRFQNEMYLEEHQRALESFGVTEQLFLILKISYTIQ